MTRTRRYGLLIVLLSALGPTPGCALFGGWDDDDCSCAALFGAATSQLAQDAPSVERGERLAARPVVRAQSADGGYGSGYSDGSYGGRAVGATSPSDSRRTVPIQPVQFTYPNTPGSAAWGTSPSGAPRTSVPTSVPRDLINNPSAYPPAPRVGNGYSAGAASAPAMSSAPVTGAPANYAYPSFNGQGGTSAAPPATSPYAAGQPNAMGASRATTTYAPPEGQYVPGTTVANPGGAFPGGVNQGPGINPGPGGSAMGDAINVPEIWRPIDLNVIVHETRTGRLMIGAGINSDAGLIGQFVIDEQNFDWKRFPTSWDDVRNGYAWRGGGQRFRFEAMPGSSVQRYLVSIQEPYLFDTPFTLGLSAFFYDRRFYDWDEERVGGRVALGYQLPHDWNVTTAFRGESVGISNPRVIPAVPEVAEVLGNNTLLGAKISVGHDTRDDAFLPTQGHIIEAGFEQVFGSFEYPITTFEARKFFTLTERIDGSGRHVIHVGGQVGWAGQDTPVYDHFYAGGYSTIRGFGFRGASPKSGDVIVGGEFQLLTTLEYMFPITADDMLRGVVFVDAGTVEERHHIDWDDFRVAPGFGLRISNAALGPAPIALDLAFPINHEDGDKIRNFSFFIGLRY